MPSLIVQFFDRFYGIKDFKFKNFPYNKLKETYFFNFSNKNLLI